MGTKITLRRHELGLTVEALAATVDEPVRVVRNWELHVPRKATDDAKWEAALQVPAGWLRAELDRPALSAARAGILRAMHSGPTSISATQLRKRYGGRDVHGRPARAKDSALQARRKYLELSLVDLSARTSIHWAVLRDFETSLPASTHLDSVIESALYLSAGALRAGAEELDGLPRIADEITSVIASLIPQVSRVTNPASAVANLQLALQRYGIHGDERTELRIISAEFELSEQHVRDVITSLIKAGNTLSVAPPAIAYLARELERMLPARLDDLTNHFRPLLGAQLSLSGVNRFATDFMGKALFFESEGLAVPLWDRAGHAPATVTTAETAHQVGTIAGAMVHRVGAAQVLVVAHAASKVLGHAISPTDVAKILWEKYTKFDWLSQEYGWFWFGPRPLSTIMDCALKLLIAADRPLSLEDVITGLTRGKLRTRGQYEVDGELPEHVLVRILETSPEVTRTAQGQFSITSTARRRAAEFVSPAEQLLVDELRRRGGAASRPDLMTDLVSSGKLGRRAFKAALTKSPLFLQLEDLCWTYVGAPTA